MAQNVSNIMFFKKNQVCKIPPRGGRVSSYGTTGPLCDQICDKGTTSFILVPEFTYELLKKADYTGQNC